MFVSPFMKGVLLSSSRAVGVWWQMGDCRAAAAVLQILLK